MSTAWATVEGDDQALLTATLSDENGVVNLTNATAVCKAKIGSTTVTKNGSIVGAASAGTLSFDFEGELPAGLGEAEIIVTFASGKQRTFPSAEKIQVRVRARL